MQILSTTSNWIKNQIRSDDFRPAPKEQSQARNHVPVGAAVGAAGGALVGGGLAYREVARDFTYFDYVTHTTPLAASGPEASQVFGADLAGYEGVVDGYSQGTTSSQETLKYLAYLKQQSPDTSTADLQGIYRSLEGQFGDDDQVRQALNMISAHVHKHGTTPNEAHAEFTHYFGYENDFNKATQTFAADQKLTPDELNTTTLQMVKRHSRPLGELGMGKAVALGAIAGAAVGALTGVVVGCAIDVWNAVARS